LPDEKHPLIPVSNCRPGIVDAAFSIAPEAFSALDLIIVVMLLMFFVLIIFLMFVVMVFLVVVIDTVVVVTGIIVVAVIGSASTGISPVSVVTAVTVIGPLAVIFLRWPTPAVAGKKGHTSRHQGRDESDEDDFPHISISHIIGSLLARLDSISQLPLFMYKGLDFSSNHNVG
jgi:hypothetical protein